MTSEEYSTAIDVIIYCCKCALDKMIPDRGIVSACNADHLYEVAGRHMLAALVGVTLSSVGIKDKRFQEAVDSSIRKTVILDEEKRKVFAELDKAGIWHMALKGTVIRDWYPAFGMRESVDCDILFDRTYEEQVRNIMVGLGYTVEHYGGASHDIYYKFEKCLSGRKRTQPVLAALRPK